MGYDDPTSTVAPVVPMTEPTTSTVAPVVPMTKPTTSTVAPVAPITEPTTVPQVVEVTKDPLATNTSPLELPAAATTAVSKTPSSTCAPGTPCGRQIDAVVNGVEKARAQLPAEYKASLDAITACAKSLVKKVLPQPPTPIQKVIK